MPIRAVIFDLGGVLEIVDDDRWWDAWSARWEAAAGRDPGSLMAGADPATRAALDDGSITEDAMRAWFRRALGLSPDRADAMLADLWDEYCGTLDVALRDFVFELRATVRTAALSNSADGARREEQRRYDLASLFEVVVYSHEVGVSKPDPAIYRLTERALDLRPDELVLLDDRPENVEGARACGWRAVLHRDTTASIREIRDLVDD